MGNVLSVYTVAGPFVFHETLLSVFYDTPSSIHKHTRASHDDLKFGHLEEFIKELVQGDETSPLKADTQKTPTTPSYPAYSTLTATKHF